MPVVKAYEIATTELSRIKENKLTLPIRSYLRELYIGIRPLLDSDQRQPPSDDPDCLFRLSRPDIESVNASIRHLNCVSQLESVQPFVDTSP